jgi:DNA-binding FadR family transcriptional regulator
MCQNPVFKVLIEVVVGILWKQRHDEPLMTVEHLRGAATQHIAIADAIMQRDSKQAEQAMLTHLEFTRTHIFSRHNGLQKPVRLMLEQSNKE